ncbi:MAG: M20/M25/M40 family metallo-hydrolase [Anaerolineae bacterium]|jgi:acetylornithine deacetylase/succinyl-diaminopimelate desuccinylase-like protein
MTSKDGVELLQRLIQFDTTNPPGHTSECIAYIDGLLTEAGIEPKILAKSPESPNLIARLSGQGNAPPLLLYGHVDVVTAEHQQWSHPPFEGKIADGFVWGRGALDMKGGVTMMLAAFLRAKAEGLALPGDVVLAVVSGEETLGDVGAKFLVEQHPELFEGIRYALGEFGGFTLPVGNRRFYPIQIAEKQVCWMKATVRGPGGHGSMPVCGGAMARLSDLLDKIDRHRLPVHVTPAARLMIDTMASSLGGVSGLMLGQLLNPRWTNRVLNLLGDRGRLFDPLVHNTVCATIVHAGTKVNVIPSAVSVELDGRLLPGYQPEDMIREVHEIVGREVELEIIHYDPGPAEPDMGLFNTLAQILREADPEGVPVPLLLSGTSDARVFSQLGIQTYGFLPMQLPEDFNFVQTIHGADERIPVEAVAFGTDAIYKVLQRFGP